MPGVRSAGPPGLLRARCLWSATRPTAAVRGRRNDLRRRVRFALDVPERLTGGRHGRGKLLERAHHLGPPIELVDSAHREAVVALDGEARAFGLDDRKGPEITTERTVVLWQVAACLGRQRDHAVIHDLENLPAPSGQTRRATRADRAALLATDAAAFEEFWRFDALALREAARATPR